jgi:regulator of sigma E protease
MISLIQTLLAFLLVIGLLVSVHEWGHYWVAKRLGVKILRFSLGFGIPLWSRRFGVDETEFVIAAIPLGGYVKMLDEREDSVAPEEVHRAFNRQSLKVRTAIVVAGPLANLIFAVLAYTATYMIGVTEIKAWIADVESQGIAATAGFRAGDEILAVNEVSATSWNNVIQNTLSKLLNEQTTINYTVQNDLGHQREVSIRLEEDVLTVDELAEGRFFDKLGLQPVRSPWPPILGEITPQSVAEKAGLQSGDKIIAVDDQPIHDWQSWVQYIYKKPNQPIKVELERKNQRLIITLTPEKVGSEGRVGIYAPYIVTEKYSIWSATYQGFIKSWEVAVLTIQITIKMLFRQVSHENISGPITIAQVAGQTAQMGLTYFLSFLALVSVSLGVINLLPIPLLDGGHLLLYFLEWVKGSPISDRTEYVLQLVGLTFLFGLMGLAIFNDLNRLLG